MYDGFEEEGHEARQEALQEEARREALLQEEMRLKFEFEELLNLKSELERRKKTERREINELQVRRQFSFQDKHRMDNLWSICTKICAAQMFMQIISLGGRG